MFYCRLCRNIPVIRKENSSNTVLQKCPFEAFPGLWEWWSRLFVLFVKFLYLCHNQVRRKGKIMQIICGLFGVLWFLFPSNRLIYWGLEGLFKSLSLRKRPGGRLGCKHSFATFFIFGVDKFIRSGLKIKVGRMAGRRKSGVRKVASGPTEGRTGGMR